MTFWRPVDSNSMPEVVEQSSDRSGVDDVVCVNLHSDEDPK